MCVLLRVLLFDFTSWCFVLSFVLSCNCHASPGGKTRSERCRTNELRVLAAGGEMGPIATECHQQTVQALSVTAPTLELVSAVAVVRCFLFLDYDRDNDDDEKNHNATDDE